ncbi:MAG TPA: metallopeptidase TldD-related protein [Candidatus Polarisedimenticolia bacterium]|jgi:PmbA protein|nr:metallopeptidase TldD-related protein [Candidatus Polarisedimenticolia bacterium]
MASKQPEEPSASFEAEIPADLDWAEGMVEEALLAGAFEAEVYLKTSSTTGIALAGGFATLAGGSERGIALRVFDDRGNFGHAFSSWGSDLRPREMIRLAVSALKDSAAGRSGAAFPAPRPARPFSDPDGLIDDNVTRMSPADKRGLLENALRAAAPGRFRPTSAAYRDGISRVALVNSRGLRAGYARTLALLRLTRAEAGGPTFHLERVAPGPDFEAFKESAQELDRIRPAGAVMEIGGADLLIEAPAAVCLLRRLEPELLEEARDAEGSRETGFLRVGSEAVTVVDDGGLAGGVASAPFDGEGNPTGRLTLVKAGVRIDRLRRPRADEIGRPGTAGRASYRELPRIAGSNLFIVPGSRRPEEILPELEQGFLLAALAADPAGGPRGEKIGWRGMGWKVRAGRRVEGCRIVAFRADPAELLEAVREVSARLRFALRGATANGAPDLLVSRGR